MGNEKRKLLNRVMICDFVLIEVALFLDTHPDDQEALAYFHKYHEMRNQAQAEYVQKYGPLTHTDVTSNTRWTYVDGPWPWENVKEG